MACLTGERDGSSEREKRKEQHRKTAGLAPMKIICCAVRTGSCLHAVPTAFRFIGSSAMY